MAHHGQHPTPASPPPYPFWLGGFAAAAAAVCTHPLDVAKVRMQTGASSSMFSTLHHAVHSQGFIHGVYVGLSASLLRQFTYSLTRFGVYDSVKQHFISTNPSRQPPSTVQLLTAAGVAGAAGGLAGNPADIILVRMIGDLNHPPDKRKGYLNCFHGLYRMMSEEGPKSLFRGLVPNVSRSVLMNASQLVTYDNFKDTLLNMGGFKEGIVLHFCASSLAGAVATTICSPFDVLKSRIMNTSSGTIGKPRSETTAWKIIHQSFKNEGVTWLFRGWTPAFVRLGPNTVLIFMGLEQLKIFWNWCH